MTRRPPSILGAFPAGDGGIEVRWEVDSFFADSEDPERVLVALNGISFDNLDGSEDSVEIPSATIIALGTAVIVISITFWWSGSPAEQQQSSFPVQVQAAGVESGGVWPAMKPIVTLVSVQARSGATPSRITINWRTNNHNDGNIFWGPQGNQRQFRSNIKPANASVVSGTFTTDQPLQPATLYFFTVEVINRLHSLTWYGTTLVVRSAAETPTFVPTTSLRQFLQRSGRPLTTGVSQVIGTTRSLRKLLLG
ncbi:MAG: hypothetical protein WAS07_15240 [Micropruina sp.]